MRSCGPTERGLACDAAGAINRCTRQRAGNWSTLISTARSRTRAGSERRACWRGERSPIRSGLGSHRQRSRSHGSQQGGGRLPHRWCPVRQRALLERYCVVPGGRLHRDGLAGTTSTQRSSRPHRRGRPTHSRRATCRCRGPIDGRLRHRLPGDEPREGLSEDRGRRRPGCTAACSLVHTAASGIRCYVGVAIDCERARSTSSQSSSIRSRAETGNTLLHGATCVGRVILRRCARRPGDCVRGERRSEIGGDATRIALHRSG